MRMGIVYLLVFLAPITYAAIARGWEPSESLVRYAIGGVALGLILAIVEVVKALKRRVHKAPVQRL